MHPTPTDRRTPITVLVVDDHPVVRQGVVAMLGEWSERFVVVGQAAAPLEALRQAQALKPDVVLTDLMFKGESDNGIFIVRELRARLPATRCLLMTSNMQGHYLVQANKAGAKGFLYKDSDARSYLQAIEALSEGMAHFPPELAAELERWDRLPRPTPSEERLLPYIARGLSAKEIAREYNHVDSPKVIEPRTIDQHKSNIKQKFSIDSMGSLVAFAIQYCDDHALDYKALPLHSKRSFFDF